MRLTVSVNGQEGETALSLPLAVTSEAPFVFLTTIAMLLFGSCSLTKLLLLDAGIATLEGDIQDSKEAFVYQIAIDDTGICTLLYYA